MIPRINGSKEEALILGLEEGEFTKTYAEWEKMVHPDDRQQIGETLRQSCCRKETAGYGI